MPVTLDSPDDDPGARLGVLFDTHHQRLYRLACRLTRTTEDAHDLVQEAFLRAARSPHSIPAGRPSEEAWLVRILVNLARDRWRAAVVRRRADEEKLIAVDESVHPERAWLARTMVQGALEQLPPRRRTILVLYELEGMPVKSIAATLKMNPITVRWHLTVARREMAKALGAGRES